jgi:hypothetical protein
MSGSYSFSLGVFTNKLNYELNAMQNCTARQRNKTTPMVKGTFVSKQQNNGLAQTKTFFSLNSCYECDGKDRLPAYRNSLVPPNRQYPKNPPFF